MESPHPPSPVSPRERMVQALHWFETTMPTQVRTHWRVIVSVAAGLFVVSLLLLTYALQAISPAALGDAGSEAAAVGDVRERALDGVFVHPSSTRLLPLGVMVENSSDAWPLQGPAKAQLVFEAPVEGSITRFLLFFDASSTVAEIGPVRSARPYFVEWAHGLEALYTHVGGSPDALSLVSSLKGFRDLNEFYNGWAFWRAAHRAAPHDVMTKTDLLLRAVEQKKYLPASFEPWTYADSPTSTEVVAETIAVPYQGIYGARWIYNAETGLYTRHNATGAIVRDADGSIVTATNVVVFLTDAQVLDDVGRLKVRTTGSGKAIIATRGGFREVQWARSPGEHIRLMGVDGSDVAFARGTTWLSAVTHQEQLDAVRVE